MLKSSPVLRLKPLPCPSAVFTVPRASDCFVYTFLRKRYFIVKIAKSHLPGHGAPVSRRLMWETARARVPLPSLPIIALAATAHRYGMGSCARAPGLEPHRQHSQTSRLHPQRVCSARAGMRERQGSKPACATDAHALLQFCMYAPRSVPACMHTKVNAITMQTCFSTLLSCITSKFRAHPSRRL